MEHGREARFLKLLPYRRVRDEIIEALSGPHLATEKVPIDSALGRVSAERVVSPADIPPVSVSAMDGYAIRSVELAQAVGSAPVRFDLVGALHPSSVRPRRPITARRAYYVGTGAPIPAGADAVVKIEETRVDGRAISVSRPIPKGKNVVPGGDDLRRGEVIVEEGDIVTAASIALLVGIGVGRLRVNRLPRIGILSTGDELAKLGEEEPGKKVNNYSNLMAGYLRDAGAVPVPIGVAGDTVEKITLAIRGSIGRLDGVLTLGGSSVGERDFTAAAIRAAPRSKEVFHGIRLVPVRPTGLYLVGRKPVVLLPGHCVAAALSFFLTVKPVVNLLSGLEFGSRTTRLAARLAEGIVNPRALGTLFLVRLSEAEGRYTARPLPWGSNRISSLLRANGFLQLEPRQKLESGAEVVVELLGTQEISRIASGEPA